MNVNPSSPGEAEGKPASGADARLSYKFQRLREKLRSAIASGELSGKLPGERQLARRFRVNAKTLSKALTDLAAEGLLERSIGRGTFVKVDAPFGTPVSASQPGERWLIVCPPGREDSAVVKGLMEANPSAQIVQETASLRPSFLSGFRALIDFDPNTSNDFLRDLVVRNISVVLVDREPTNYSVNAVMIDRTLGATHLARDLMLMGHRRFLAVERQGCVEICQAVRHAAQRYAPDASIDVAYPSEASGAVEQGATAVICDSSETAAEVRHAMGKKGIAIPGRASLCAIGAATSDDAPCTGYFVDPSQKAHAIVQLLRDSSARRPSNLWLIGKFIEAGTIGPTDTMSAEAASRFDTLSA